MEAPALRHLGLEPPGRSTVSQKNRTESEPLMEKSTLLIFLTLFTLLSGMAVAAYQLWAVEKAKKSD